MQSVQMDESIHHYQDLITIFNHCFLETYNTVLAKGDDEPLYIPSNGNLKHHTIYFARGFFASALHECSHWLIAGAERRKLVDFGYWYIPDGRTAKEQELFQKAEVKPQAMEWILSMAAGTPFRVSVDNLNGSESGTLEFKKAVHSQVNVYCKNGLSERAELFRLALCRFYKISQTLRVEDFNLENLESP